VNFLAHLFFADDSPASAVGCLLPDFVKGSLSQVPAGPMRDAAELHRLIDRYTDSHPAVRLSMRRLRPGCGHFSAIAVDVLYDHLLSRRWTAYHPMPLDAFIQRAYRHLAEGAGQAPERMRSVLADIVQEDWLRLYGTVDGIRFTLGRMSQRFTRRFNRPVDLLPAAAVLEAQLIELTHEFDTFFPELLLRVAAEQVPAQ
jgi:acyl carrier protein phosphodiesterase